MRDYFHRIESIHRALHIPTNYGALRQLTPYLEASELISVEGHEQQQHLTPRAALQWQAMKSAASNKGIELLLISGFRSVDRQREIIERKLREAWT
jgi:zinc D-Ala-D-Ala carboxypeptidase